MKRIRFLLYTFLSITLLLLIFSLVRNFWYQGKRGVLEDLPLDRADMQLGTIHFTETRGDVKEWELTAEDVEYFKDKRVMLFKGIKVLFFPESSGPVAIEGKEGRINTYSGDIEVSGDVVVTSLEGQSLYTDFLRYRSDRETITTESEISILGPDITVRGKGLSLDIKNNKFAILANVHTELKGVLK